MRWSCTFDSLEHKKAPLRIERYAAGVNADRASFTKAAGHFALEVARAPHDAAAWHGLALAFHGEGNDIAALGAARRAISENPDLLAAQLTLGRLCERAGYAQDAIVAFESARRIAPLDAHVARCLAQAYRRGGRVRDALVVADAAAELGPPSADGYLCLGDALLANDAEVAADRMYEKALALDPQMALAECGRGAVLLMGAQWQAARTAFERALALAPDCAEARYNLALIDLRCGAYGAGFARYAAIMDTAEQWPRYHYYHAGVPVWDGAQLEKRRLVIAYEMGLGNQIQMARFFNALRSFGESITIEAPPVLLSLLRRNFPHLTFAGFTNWQPLEVMDVHLPLMQLPAVLHVTHEADFAMRAPYLTADPGRLEAMRAKLQLAPGVRHVGIVWHGNRENARDRWRAAPLSDWAPLAGVPGIRFHSLQLGATPAERAEAPFPLAPTHELIGDMDDTAALAMLMDGIVTVDTSVVHLAGALGRPLWMPQPFLSDYRWEIDRADSPWYPTLQIFRQRARDDWQPVFRDIATQLAQKKCNCDHEE
jgi:tetratricopeptide (TPR) repeat protein